MKPSPGCRLWPFAKLDTGYGVMRVGPRPGVMIRVHVATCERWNGPRPAGMEVAHNCGNRACWAGEHLRWATHRDNIEDARRHHTMVTGQDHPLAVLNDNKVREIRQRNAAGVSQCQLAREYGVTQVAIHNVVKRKSWKHVE